MAKVKRPRSAPAKPSLNEEEKSSIHEDEELLVKQIHLLRDAIPPGHDKITSILDCIAESVKSVSKDLSTKRQQINELKIRVSDLEQQLKKFRNTAGTIDAGEAMKIMETHVAALVLPKGTSVAKAAALKQMLEYVEKLEPGGAWDVLQEQCAMTWTPTHDEVKNDLIQYRNSNAHHKKFNFVQLRETAKEIMPHRAKQCEDIINLFEKVNSLMKFGVIASDSVLCKVVEEKHSEAHVDALNRVAEKCHREIQHLQDVKIDKAREHLVQYFPEIEEAIWPNIIEEIKTTNRLRLGKLVKEKEKQIVTEILQKLIQKPTSLTFQVMNIYLINGSIPENKQTEITEKWSKLRNGKDWTTNHSEAMTKLKELLPASHSETVEDLPLNIAQLHIAHFLDENLWDAGSDILEIFKRQRKN